MPIAAALCRQVSPKIATAIAIDIPSNTGHPAKSGETKALATPTFAEKAMAQVKKPEAREAILQAAFGLFSQHDYASVTIAQIARRAHLSTSNIYVYFASKRDILWAVMSPWLFRQIELLDAELTVIAEPRARIERILTALWGDIPSADNNLSLNLLQALALSAPNDRYSGELLGFLQKRVTRMLADCLPAERRHVLGEHDAFAHLAFMAFDGFALNTRLNGRSDNLQQIVRITTDLLLGVTDPMGPRGVDAMPQPSDPAIAALRNSER